MDFKTFFLLPIATPFLSITFLSSSIFLQPSPTHLTVFFSIATINLQHNFLLSLSSLLTSSTSQLYSSLPPWSPSEHPNDVLQISPFPLPYQHKPHNHPSSILNLHITHHQNFFFWPTQPTPLSSESPPLTTFSSTVIQLTLKPLSKHNS